MIVTEHTRCLNFRWFYLSSSSNHHTSQEMHVSFTSSSIERIQEISLQLLIELNKNAFFGCDFFSFGRNIKMFPCYYKKHFKINFACFFFHLAFYFVILKNLQKGKTIEISECAKLNIRSRRRRSRKKKMLKIQMIRGISQL